VLALVPGAGGLVLVAVMRRSARPLGRRVPPLGAVGRLVGVHLDVGVRGVAAGCGAAGCGAAAPGGQRRHPVRAEERRAVGREQLAFVVHRAADGRRAQR